MPVVLVEVGGVARSGHLYGDRTGIEYEYPGGRYEAWIQPGERFVYQVPRVGYVLALFKRARVAVEARRAFVLHQRRAPDARGPGVDPL
jgi:hypothetical protein